MDAQIVDHLETERNLRDLLNEVGLALTRKDQAEAADYLAATEYGLALETIAGGLLDRDETIVPQLAKRIESLAEAMRLTDRPFVKEVHTRAAE